MAVSPPPPAPEQLQLAAFDQQPTPIVILSDRCTIALVNRSCQQLFSKASNLTGRDVSALPLVWQDGSAEEFHDLLTTEKDCSLRLDVNFPEYAQELLRLQVDIRDGPQTMLVSAGLLVTDFKIGGNHYRMLSFEGVTRNYTAFLDPDEYPGPRTSIVPAEPRTVHFERPHPAARDSTTATSQEQLDARFAQLRDAVYFGMRDQSGFLLSADETFCFPNYQGSRRVTPVEVDDVELFFQEWDVWDPHFTEKLPISEYPSIWLNRHQEYFEKRRYGLKESGKRKVLEATGEPLYDHLTREYLGGVVWLKDLGEYEDVVAQDLKTDLADFRAMCDRLPHILWTMDNNGHADYFSQSWYDFTGLTEEQSLGLEYSHAIHTGDLEKAWMKFTAASEAKVECLFEARYRRHDGQWFWMSVRSKPYFDSDGNVLKWYGTSTNIDSIMIERLNAEKQRSQMMGMLSLADVGLFEVDDSWKLTLLEGEMHWIDQEHITQVLVKSGGAQDDEAQILKARLKDVMVNQQQTAVFEDKIGARWYKFRLVTNTDSNHGVDNPRRKVLGCSVDITEQRMRLALETENTRLAHEASLETEKNRLKSAFLAHMSHEIRTPIAGIIGTANSLAETSLDTEQKDAINDIQVSGNNLLSIVNDVLDFSKIEAGKMVYERVRYDIHKIVLQVKRSFEYAVREKSLQIFCQQDLNTPLHLIGDPGKVRQILTNLVANAVKFTNSGSVELSVITTDRKVRIAVKDTGTGIDEQTMSVLFKPFVQGDASTARRYGGTGLGLTISRDFAEKMGGSLTLTSVPSQGTEAILLLPKEFITIDAKHEEVDIGAKQNEVKSEPEPLPQSESTVQAVKPSEHLVLVVEDNAINQKVAMNLVRKLGYRAAAAWNGQEALDHVEKAEPPSLILMDCQMPLMDGYQATKELRTNDRYRHAKSVPIIALTASAILGDKEKCHAVGMDDYLTKPVTKKSLEATFEKFSFDGALRRLDIEVSG